MIPDIQKKAVEEFQRIFTADPDSIFFAPGRVNLIGEHTDYNNGFVLPSAIDFGTYLVLKRRTDNTIRVVAGNLDDRTSEWQTDQPIAHDLSETWSDYLRGVSAYFQNEGMAVEGMDVYAVGNVPRGAGLSSSASFSVAFATACNEMNNLQLDKRQIARIAQRAENDFAGCNCGIMDQLASAAGEPDSAILLDCQNLEYKAVRIPDNLDLMIIDSKIERQLVGSEYNDRRADCERAAKTMRLNSLREADLGMLAAYQPKLDERAFRRARHILTENDRTLKAAEALANGDMPQLHQLMADSHISMRDDFEITVPAIDFLVTTVEQQLGSEGGVRMTGGGFGGCVVALAPRERRQAITEHVKNDYLKRFERAAEIHICRASGGAGKVC